FNQINKKTGNRIRYRKVDAETGDEVDSSDIIKGYEVGKGQYIEIQPEELEAVAIESKRTIEIDEFVPKKEIDELYLNSLDQYEDALKELLKKKQAGEKIEAPKERAPAKVINLMDALRRSVEAERGGGERRKRPAAASHRTPKKAGRSSRHKEAG